jgi:hypothetical protein
VKFNGKASVLEVEGRGGTDMSEAIEHALSLPKKPLCHHHRHRR